MSDPSHIEVDAPPAGEHIHMPSSSILPLLNAIGLALVIVNITGSMPILIAAAVLWVTTTVLWIRSAVRETGELPLDHGH